VWTAVINCDWPVSYYGTAAPEMSPTGGSVPVQSLSARHARLDFLSAAEYPDPPKFLPPPPKIRRKNADSRDNRRRISENY